MRITVNRAPEEYPEEALTLRQLLDRKKWSFPLIIARVNGGLVDRKDYESTWIRDGADIDLYHLASGG